MRIVSDHHILRDADIIEEYFPLIQSPLTQLVQGAPREIPGNCSGTTAIPPTFADKFLGFFPQIH